MKLYSSLALLFLAAAPLSTAAIALTTPTSTTPGSLQITEDITFTFTASGTVPGFYVVFSGWVAADDGSSTSVTLSPNAGYSFNGGTTLNASSTAIFDNFASDLADISADDGVLALAFAQPLSFIPGDLFTLKSATFTIPATAGFNPAAGGTFTGDVFLAHVPWFTRVSDVEAVPEPAAVSLAAVGLGLAACRRRRR